MEPHIPVHIDVDTEEVSEVVIRFCGDSGDGMQLTGSRFTETSAYLGNDIATFPDFPAEIRAPAGSLAGVSGYQVNFSSKDILTPGDSPDVLVAMNPAALKTNLGDLKTGGILVVNQDAFTPENLELAGYKSNPLEDETLISQYRFYKLPITSLTTKALEELGLTRKEAERCKNLFALGVMYWLYERPMEATLQWIDKKFKNKPIIAQANKKALNSGFNYAETTDIFKKHYRVARASLEQGTYRHITGNEATALGFIAASQLSGKQLVYGSYPITPASDILHELSRYKNFGVKTCQAEDEIAAVGMALGASFAGAIGLTGTSGPGLALKSETISLAISMELPLIIINVQRGGPSTGLPTKTEQADLLQAMYGRHGESPLVVIAPATPSDCFALAIEATRIALTTMTPVIYLSDGYLANGAEPWKLPDVDKIPKIEVHHPVSDGNKFLSYQRNPETLARPWAIPGTPGLEHRLGGIEKADGTGNISYDPQNHEKMVHIRAEKVARIARMIPPVEIFGKSSGKALIVGWGGTYGSITSAVKRLQEEGLPVSSIHLRYLNPFPANLRDVLSQFETIIVPELNLGQLAMILRSQFLVEAQSLTKVQGKPFKIQEIVDGIKKILEK